MSTVNKLFLMLDQERTYGHLVSGSDPAGAVETYYAELDAWCAPSPDAEIDEEFLVLLYEVPAQLEDDVHQRFEDLDGDEFPDQVTAFCRENPSIAVIEVNVSYTARGGAKASELPHLPNLFDRRSEG